MAKGQLFEYTVLYHPRPTRDQLDAGETPKTQIVVKHTQILATSQQEVAARVAKELPEEYLDKFSDVEILVRPF